MSRGRPSKGRAGRRRTLDAARQAFITAMRRGDAGALGSLYALDAIVVPQFSKVVRGRASIEKLFRDWLSSTGIRKFGVTTENIRIIDNTAYAVGTYRMVCEGARGGRLRDEGKYLMIYQRGRNGKWQIARDMSSSSRR